MACMSNITAALILGFAVLAPGERATAADFPFERAEIYYYGWGVLTRGALSLDDVRRNARVVTRINDKYEASKLGEVLRLGALNQMHPGQKRTGDPRLVIDLWDGASARQTYFA